eukprot:8228-Heterococcus_DN1.PRE.1
MSCLRRSLLQAAGAPWAVAALCLCAARGPERRQRLLVARRAPPRRRLADGQRQSLAEGLSERRCSAGSARRCTTGDAPVVSHCLCHKARHWQRQSELLLRCPVWPRTRNVLQE